MDASDKLPQRRAQSRAGRPAPLFCSRSSLRINASEILPGKFQIFFVRTGIGPGSMRQRDVVLAQLADHGSVMQTDLPHNLMAGTGAEENLGWQARLHPLPNPLL